MNFLLHAFAMMVLFPAYLLASNPADPPRLLATILSEIDTVIIAEVLEGKVDQYEPTKASVSADFKAKSYKLHILERPMGGKVPDFIKIRSQYSLAVGGRYIILLGKFNEFHGYPTTAFRIRSNFGKIAFDQVQCSETRMMISFPEELKCVPVTLEFCVGETASTCPEAVAYSYIPIEKFKAYLTTRLRSKSD